MVSTTSATARIFHLSPNQGCRIDAVPDLAIVEQDVQRNVIHGFSRIPRFLAMIDSRREKFIQISLY